MRPFTATFVSIFPEVVRSYVSASILGRAQRAEKLLVEEVAIRDFALDKHKNVDDSPCGGGPGLVMRIDVVERALAHAIKLDDQAANGTPRKRRVLLFDAAAKPFTQKDAKRLATYDHLVLLCGRYEGIDARIHDLVDERVCIGDYVLTGGELAGMVVLDATVRHLPGVLGNEASAEDESFADGAVEHRQYTRPIEHKGRRVPTILTSGNHPLIAKARRKDQLLRTKFSRPDLYANLELTKADKKILKDEKIPTLDADGTQLADTTHAEHEVVDDRGELSTSTSSSSTSTSSTSD
ncbi:MAG: tRNA (guanosine(37)-N1)-methyltransferase TrmD [Deltaproteobacteria bacterium]|nr:tRNA (guanosine(37)-N1)-methyltransferase TrmD [Deltaproteobacteria bacterium]